uniref:Uncharacterized protein n=1 Tax=Panagrolaimus sp. JU765 TaxID=591449 RepID=A0AC34RJC8_9BILA
MHTYSQLPPASPLASTSNSASNSGLNVSNNFLDPHFRRKLPAVPGTHGSLSPTSFRRSSSPRSPSIGRTLPTPPGERGTSESVLCSTPSSPHFSSASPSPPCTGAYLEQRHRKLPPEPMKTPPVQQNSLPAPFTSPAPMNHQLSSPALISKSASRNNIQNHRILPSPEPLLTPEPLQMPSKNYALAKSAPQSPRTIEQPSESNGLTVNDAVLRTRKFSDVRDIARNGSMAHVLEQQHILRQEFTQTPDSALAQSVSNHSSLSPSIEQVGL